LREIRSERDLRAALRDICRRINELGDDSVLFLANPFLALEEEGYTFSPQMRKHVCRALGATFVSRGTFAEIKSRQSRFPWIRRVRFPGVSKRKD